MQSSVFQISMLVGVPLCIFGIVLWLFIKHKNVIFGINSKNKAESITGHFAFKDFKLNLYGIGATVLLVIFLASLYYLFEREIISMLVSGFAVIGAFTLWVPFILKNSGKRADVVVKGGREADVESRKEVDK